MNNTYDVIIGLEIHIEPTTKSKMFCNCSADYFGADPNTHTCPVCLGLPGAMPKANKLAITYAQMLGFALNCQVELNSKFDRKNYFYPDLAKGFQISQYDQPFSQKGFVMINTSQGQKRINVTRAHLEEDTGKLTHAEVSGKKVSFIDFNRSGLPLIEIVSEPEMRSSEEAKAYAQKLQQIVRYLKISDCDMDKGSMRIEPNISLRPKGQKTLPNYKVELKNINSFRFVQKAIEYEIVRQTEILEKGEVPAQETRGWNEFKNKTFSQRSKEFAHDYRYFPEPDIPPFTFTKKELDVIKSKIPELPDAKNDRFQKEYGLSAYDTGILTDTRQLADFFEEALKAYPEGEPKRIANWVIGELARRINETQKPFSEIKILPASLAELLLLVDRGEITTASAKQIFEKMFETGNTAAAIISEMGIQALSQEKLEEVVDSVLKANQKAVEDIKAGKTQAFGFLVGQVQRQTQGAANPALVKEIIERKVDSQN